jgi:hypothetical protein
MADDVFGLEVRRNDDPLGSGQPKGRKQMLMKLRQTDRLDLPTSERDSLDAHRIAWYPLLGSALA